MERKQQPTTEGKREVLGSILVYKMKCSSRSQIQTQENKKANINVKDLTILKHVCIMSLSLCLYVCLSVIIKTRSSDFPE